MPRISRSAAVAGAVLATGLLGAPTALAVDDPVGTVTTTTQTVTDTVTSTTDPVVDKVTSTTTQATAPVVESVQQTTQQATATTQQATQQATSTTQQTTQQVTTTTQQATRSTSTTTAAPRVGTSTQSVTGSGTSASGTTASGASTGGSASGGSSSGSGGGSRTGSRTDVAPAPVRPEMGSSGATGAATVLLSNPALVSTHADPIVAEPPPSPGGGSFGYLPETETQGSFGYLPETAMAGLAWTGMPSALLPISVALLLAGAGAAAIGRRVQVLTPEV